ncbi:hypothetical protein G9A89_008862 [Geosiphon pyriformis]|nr:hypothetical protein G9A89_008862 [Geosiphon pyriformis]
MSDSTVRKRLAKVLALDLKQKAFFGKVKHLGNKADLSFGGPKYIVGQFAKMNIDENAPKIVFLSGDASYGASNKDDKQKWIDLKLTKTQIEIPVRKFFVLDINLSAMEDKSATAKT